MAMSRAPRVHPAWIVLGALTVCMLAGSGLRSVFGVYIKPMEAEFGWTRGALSAGQLTVIPLATALTVWFGWRTSFLWLGIGLLVLVLPVCLALIRNNPEDRGARPYGATGPAPTRAEAEATRVAGRVGVSEAAQTLPFWLLMGTFFVCGYKIGRASC